MLIFRRHVLLISMFALLVLLVVATLTMGIHLSGEVQEMRQSLEEYQNDIDLLQISKNKLSAEISYLSSPLYLQKIQQKYFADFSLIKRNVLMSEVPFRHHPKAEMLTTSEEN